MIDKETFRKTERKLYNYYCKDRRIQSLNRKIELLKKQINDIDIKLRNVDVNIPEESRAITYEERIQTSNNSASYAEQALMRITDRLLNEKTRKEEEIGLLEEEIRNIEADNIIIEDNIGELGEEDKKFLKLKYGKGKKDWQLGNDLGMDQSTATRKRQKLVENVAKWEEWYKKIY
ncbi:hypothetical protein phiCT9441A_30 (endogenous virus) [Clostridium phage phiCT9441A]|uniref:hypothetical protein n=1 Tax=Clostridium phage phiCT9441A TaxID=1567014 RepID=UPI000572AA65|nr:hypothetical protein [Clostridium tetani]YP_009219395.1 hypothetical protein phiCT9441A_30 [Clostridium phage phiCT9441A]AJA42642.1 hypothetical protein phiCT9441A_30 [Clostridium phage phiCT9441A]SUY66129.1 phage protein [Clostridium tetani]